MRRWIIGGSVVVILLYAALTFALWNVMKRPPEDFGQVMKHVPMPLMIVLPFEPLWLHARAGTIEPGDAAPDFNLESVDRTSRIHLKDEIGKPVVLVFGSYT